MKWAAILLALAPSLACAQGGSLQQGGAVTPGHVPVFVTNGVVGDGGSAQNGNAKEIGITNSGTPFCINDAPTTGPYHQLCFGANALGGGLVSFQAYNGAPVTSLMCNINGVLIPCELSASNVQNLPGPLSVAGNITTPAGVSALGLTAGTDGIVSTGPIVGKNGLDISGTSNLAGTLNVSGNVNTPAGVGALGVTAGTDGIISNGPLAVTGTTNIQGLLNVSGNITTPAGVGALGVTAGTDGIISDGPLVVSGETIIDGQLTASGAEIGGNGLVVDGGMIVNGLNSVFKQGLVVNAATGHLVALEANGDLEIFGDAFANSWQINSDRRLKSDIEDFKPHGIASVQKLHPVSFRFGAGGVRRRHYGLLADEVEKVVPEAVSERKGVKTLDPMALIDVLITANRELAERVEALEKRLPAAH